MADYTTLLEGKKSLSLKAIPHSRKTAITGYDEAQDLFTMTVKAPPEDGKANAEIERHLAKLTGREAKIITGKRSKRKTIKLR